MLHFVQDIRHASAHLCHLLGWTGSLVSTLRIIGQAWADSPILPMSRYKQVQLRVAVWPCNKTCESVCDPFGVFKHIQHLRNPTTSTAQHSTRISKDMATKFNNLCRGNALSSHHTSSRSTTNSLLLSPACYSPRSPCSFQKRHLSMKELDTDRDGALSPALASVPDLANQRQDASVWSF
jgi:hypothetical protein